MSPKLLKNGSRVVCIAGSQCLIYSTGSGERRLLDIDSRHREQVEKQSTHSVAGRILAAAFSHTGQYFAVTNDCKQLLVYSTSGAIHEWKIAVECRVAKKGVVLTFARDDSEVLVADKFGDVLAYSLVLPAAADGRLILGHLSMILDVSFLSSDRYLATCDRDEKIRISHYPCAYDIQSFCLGHRKLVTRLAPAGDGLLVSGGADGSVRLWDYVSGMQLSFADCAGMPSLNLTREKAIVSILLWVPKHRSVVAAFEGGHSIIVVQVKEENDGISGGQRLECVQVLALSMPFWDVCVDSDDVYVLQPNEEKPIATFTFDSDGVLAELPLGNGDADHDAVCRAVRSDWNILKQFEGEQEFYGKLEKMAVDNMSDYLLKKRERIDCAKSQQQLQSAGEPPMKTVKV